MAPPPLARLENLESTVFTAPRRLARPRRLTCVAVVAGLLLGAAPGAEARRRKPTPRPSAAEREQARVDALTTAVRRDLRARVALAFELLAKGSVQLPDAAGQPVSVSLVNPAPLRLPTDGPAKLSAWFARHGLRPRGPAATPGPASPPALRLGPSVGTDTPTQAWVRLLVWAQHALVDGAALGARSQPPAPHRRQTAAEREAVAADARRRTHRALTHVAQALARPEALDAVFAGWLNDLGVGRWPAYAALVRALATVRELAASPPAPLGPDFPVADKQAWRKPTLRRRWYRRVKATHVAALRVRLCAEGDCVAPPPVAAPGAKKLRRPVGLGVELRAALKRWQRRHGLKPHGLIDGATRDALDTPTRVRVQQIELALQRMRDTGLGSEDHFLVANVPAFEVSVWRAGQHVRTHRTQVGRGVKRVRRGWIAGNRTPLLSMRLRFLVLNPEWVVPTSIRREYRWKIRKDPEFLAKNGFEMRKAKGGGERMVMLSGEKNLLGRVKFLFPNPHLVYLHDTPSKRSFSLTRRTRSHGCVRVEHAEDLARYLLEQDGHRKFNTRRWAKLMDRSVNKWKPLRKHVGIHLTYWTADTTAAGAPRYFPDVYRFDPRDRARVEAVDRARLAGAVAGP